MNSAIGGVVAAGLVAAPDEERRASARRALAGSAFGTLAAVVTAGWWVVTRAGVGGELDGYDLAALRYGISGLLLLPVLLRFRRRIATVRPLLLAVMAVGAGAPFALVNATGLAFASAGNGGALMPGLLPLFSAVLAVVFLKERIGAVRRLGIAVIVAGVVAIAAKGLLAGLHATPGHALFVLGALLWSGFAVALRQAGLTSLQAIATVSVFSMIGYLPVYAALTEPGLLSAPPAETLFQGLYQGVMAGIVVIYGFSQAVHLLGPSRAALFGALVPVLTTAMGAAFLGEAPSLAEMVGVAAVSVGAVLATGGLVGGRG